MEKWGSNGETEARVTWGHHRAREQSHPRTSQTSPAAHTWKNKNPLAMPKMGGSVDKGGTWTPRGEGRVKGTGGGAGEAAGAPCQLYPEKGK